MNKAQQVMDLISEVTASLEPGSWEYGKLDLARAYAQEMGEALTELGLPSVLRTAGSFPAWPHELEVPARADEDATYDKLENEGRVPGAF